MCKLAQELWDLWRKNYGIARRNFGILHVQSYIIPVGR